MEYITSDLHLGHHKICGIDGFCSTRRHFATADAMNGEITRNWNSRVTNADTVYHLGDLCINLKPAEVYDLLMRLNGTVYLVKGNHDSSRYFKYLTNPDRNPVMPTTKQPKFQTIPMGTIIKRNGIQYYLTHYPQGLGQHRKTIRNLCGHIHENAAHDANVLNVGIDSPEIGVRPFGQPVPLLEAMELLDTKWETWHGQQT